MEHQFGKYSLRELPLCIIRVGAQDGAGSGCRLCLAPSTLLAVLGSNPRCTSRVRVCGGPKSIEILI